ncbi:MAG: DUF4416 family protein [Candidatus Omnitrophota bacterium]
MAIAQKPELVKLIVGVIFSNEGVLAQAKLKLIRKFGPIDFQSAIMPFVYTDYYEKEMGPGLKRQFLSFCKLVQPEALATIKRSTNRLETALYAKSGPFKRTINLDPGYITAAKLVLATCKDYTHRIYLGKGIFAEVTLQFHNGSFAPWPWTYPDYTTAAYLDICNAIRRIYLKQV